MLRRRPIRIATQCPRCRSSRVCPIASKSICPGVRPAASWYLTNGAARLLHIASTLYVCTRRSRGEQLTFDQYAHPKGPLPLRPVLVVTARATVALYFRQSIWLCYLLFDDHYVALRPAQPGFYPQLVSSSSASNNPTIVWRCEKCLNR